MDKWFELISSSTLGRDKKQRFHSHYLNACHHRHRAIGGCSCISHVVEETTPYLFGHTCFCRTNDAYQFRNTAIIEGGKNEEFESRSIDNLPWAIHWFGVARICRQTAFNVHGQNGAPCNSIWNAIWISSINVAACNNEIWLLVDSHYSTSTWAESAQKWKSNEACGWNLLRGLPRKRLRIKTASSILYSSLTSS